MKTTKILICVSILIISISCGKAPEEPHYSSPNESASSINTDGLRTKEIKTTLNCYVSIEGQIKDQFIWENPNELTLVKILNYRIDNKDTSFIIRLAGSLQGTHLDLLYLRTAKNVLNDGSIHDRTLYRSVTIHENSDTKIYDINSEIIFCKLKRVTP